MDLQNDKLIEVLATGSDGDDRPRRLVLNAGILAQVQFCLPLCYAPNSHLEASSLSMRAFHLRSILRASRWSLDGNCMSDSTSVAVQRRTRLAQKIFRPFVVLIIWNREEFFVEVETREKQGGCEPSFPLTIVRTDVPPPYLIRSSTNHDWSMLAEVLT